MDPHVCHDKANITFEKNLSNLKLPLPTINASSTITNSTVQSFNSTKAEQSLVSSLSISLKKLCNKTLKNENFENGNKITKYVKEKNNDSKPLKDNILFDNKTFENNVLKVFFFLFNKYF